MIYSDEDEFCKRCGQPLQEQSKPVQVIEKLEVVDYVVEQLFKEGTLALPEEVEKVVDLICEYVALNGGYFYGE